MTENASARAHRKLALDRFNIKISRKYFGSKIFGRDCKDSDNVKKNIDFFKILDRNIFLKFSTLEF